MADDPGDHDPPNDPFDALLPSERFSLTPAERNAVLRALRDGTGAESVTLHDDGVVVAVEGGRVDAKTIRLLFAEVHRSVSDARATLAWFDAVVAGHADLACGPEGELIIARPLRQWLCEDHRSTFTWPGEEEQDDG